MLVKSEIIELLNGVLKQTARLRKGGDELSYYCFNCHHRKRKLEICLEDGKRFGWFYCWTCQISGGLKKLLRLTNASQFYYDKLSALTKDIISIKRNSSPIRCDKISLPQEFLPLSRSRNTPEYKNAMMYLKRRGVLMVDILRYNIGYCEGGGEYEQHIIIPSYDANGTLNFFIGRRYYETERNSLPYKKPRGNMNIVGFECFVNWKEPLNLVEGVFDAIAVRNNAVPLFGKFMSPKLRESMIHNKTKRVNMILDNDALVDAVANCTVMEKLGIAVHLVKLDGKDPSILGFERIHDLIRHSKEFDWDEKRKYKLEL